MFPGHSRHRVVVFDLLAADLVPLWPLRVEVVDVEAVEVSDDGGLASGVESGASKLLDLVIFGVVETLEAVARWLVEGNLAIVAGSEDVRAPGEGVRDRGVLQLVASLCLEVKRHHRAVKMPRDYRPSVWRGADRHDERLRSVNGLALVVPQEANLHFALLQAEEELLVAIVGPAHAGDRAVLQELVADGLLLTPLRANLVDEDDVVRLRDGDLLIIWGEANSAHNVALVVLLGGTRRELVLLLAILVVQVDDAISSRNRVSLRVLRPSEGRDLLHAVDGLLQILPVFDLHFR